MDPNKKVAVIHNFIGDESSPDEADVLEQVSSVSNALAELGFDPVPVPVTLNLQQTSEILKALKPLFAFNLFESTDSTGRFICFIPALLDHLKIPYTGSGTNEIFITTNKVITKEYLRNYGLPTPDWTTPDKIIYRNAKFNFPGIIKPVWEDASVGLDSDSVISDLEALLECRTCRQAGVNNSENNDDFFIEEYIDGREFNISILASPEGPQVLPQAEIEFNNFPDDEPKIVGYKAKWDEDSFECRNTVRTFNRSVSDEILFEKLSELSLFCWKKFNLNGYVRVDYRIRENGNPEILEINANPCISPDSGFTAACENAGIGYMKMIQRIINSVKFK